jgi:hypothetical protein
MLFPTTGLPTSHSRLSTILSSGAITETYSNTACWNSRNDKPTSCDPFQEESATSGGLMRRGSTNLKKKENDQPLFLSIRRISEEGKKAQRSCKM